MFESGHSSPQLGDDEQGLSQLIQLEYCLASNIGNSKTNHMPMPLFFYFLKLIKQSEALSNVLYALCRERLKLHSSLNLVSLGHIYDYHRRTVSSQILFGNTLLPLSVGDRMNRNLGKRNKCVRVEIDLSVTTLRGITDR